MKKTIKIFTIITILTSIVFSQQLVDGIAAIVGEKIILSSEVQQLTFELAQKPGNKSHNRPKPVWNSI